MSSPMWPEVRKALDEKRYELVLVGPEVAKRVEDNGHCMDEHIYDLKILNFLEIAKTSLSSLSTKLASMENMTNLLIHSNNLTSVPEEIGQLKHLKNLNFSNNKLTEVPQSLKNCKELFTINFSGNQLTKLFPLVGLEKLAVLDINRNNFTHLPEDLGDASLENLSTVDASYNQLEEIPDLTQLPSLKLLNVENNVLTVIPNNLCQCAKLKELLMKTNKIKDNRLKKLVEQDKGKAIIDYLERNYVEECKKSNAKKPVAQTESLIAKKKNKKKADAIVEFDRINVLHFSYSETDTTVLNNKIVLEESTGVQEIRPHILCCVCRNLDLETSGNFKKFLNIQTKIQDEVCEKRNLATIATHDITKLKGNTLYYEANNPNLINFVPLGRKYPITATEFYEKLVEEAEAERKQKKRNQLSGVYKYISLVETNKRRFVYLRDGEGNIISLPPLTNSENTRMTNTTKDILIEITSNHSMEFCKQIMEKLFVEMLNAGVASKLLDENSNEAMVKKLSELQLQADENDTSVQSEDDTEKKLRHTLLLQQTKVIDSKGALKTVYPSRVDLAFDDSGKYKVQRLYGEDSA